MNEQELRDFKAARRPSPHVDRKDVAALHCYGCAHSAALAPPPGHPSGERPCCSCVRNAARELEPGTTSRSSRTRGHGRAGVVVGDDGHARDFDPFSGALYNGAPTVYFPQDNYVTMDQRDQERFLDEHPEYAKPVRFVDGRLVVATDGHLAVEGGG